MNKYTDFFEKYNIKDCSLFRYFTLVNVDLDMSSLMLKLPEIDFIKPAKIKEVLTDLKIVVKINKTNISEHLLKYFLSRFSMSCLWLEDELYNSFIAKAKSFNKIDLLKDDFHRVSIPDTFYMLYFASKNNIKLDGDDINKLRDEILSSVESDYDLLQVLLQSYITSMNITVYSEKRDIEFLSITKKYKKLLNKNSPSKSNSVPIDVSSLQNVNEEMKLKLSLYENELNNLNLSISKAQNEIINLSKYKDYYYSLKEAEKLELIEETPVCYDFDILSTLGEFRFVFLGGLDIWKFPYKCVKYFQEKGLNCIGLKKWSKNYPPTIYKGDFVILNVYGISHNSYYVLMNKINSLNLKFICTIAQNPDRILHLIKLKTIFENNNQVSHI